MPKQFSTPINKRKSLFFDEKGKTVDSRKIITNAFFK